ncbi:hypothetical protein HNR22_005006 [Micromonospora jinlongensis]|uniref:Uncharacterized protein n=1 Tax=Micromonospora jinlongensis TaxID=1287877 RepID=A0A7Y9X599_9ACTN|nr:hypothetical protein [Micromonospora jinlongensis]NYH45279.1 hypothetical protein [Micromonospora jinlongensis]
MEDDGPDPDPPAEPAVLGHGCAPATTTMGRNRVVGSGALGVAGLAAWAVVGAG